MFVLGMDRNTDTNQLTGVLVPRYVPHKKKGQYLGIRRVYVMLVVFYCAGCHVAPHLAGWRAGLLHRVRTSGAK